MYENILIPTDGSDSAERAVDHALPIAERTDATIHTLYVVDHRITMAADENVQTDIRDSLESEGTMALDAVAERARDRGLDTVAERRTGTPWKEILDYVDTHGIDLIVIGSHGKSPREKMNTLGSVSERVVDNASVPTLVVRAER